MATEQELQAHSKYWKAQEPSTAWLADAVKGVLGAAKMPVDMGADALRNATAWMLGGKLNDPAKHTTAGYESLNRAANNVINPVIGTGKDVLSAAQSGLSGAATNLGNARQAALGALDASPMEAPTGTTPTAGGALPAPGYGVAMPKMAAPSSAVAPVRAPAARPMRTAQEMAAQIFPTTTMPPVQDMMAETGPTPGAAVSTEAQAPQTATAPTKAQTLKEMYEEMLAKSGKEVKGDLTPEQKNRLYLMLGLNMMSRSAKPGAYALGAFGDAGMDTMKEVGEMEKGNLTRSTADLQRTRDDAFRSIGFADKDADNVRADQRANTEERRWIAAEARDKQRLDLEMRKLEADGKKPTGHVPLGNGNIGLILPDGTVKDSGIKAKGREPDANERAMAMLTGRGGLTAQEAMDRVFPPKSRVVVEDYLDHENLDAMGQPTRLRRAIDVNTGEPVRKASGQSGPQKPDPSAYKDRTITGPDGKFKSDGTKWVKVQ